MTYRASSSTKKGIILADILLALSLGAFFVAIIAQSSAGSRLLFERAREREVLLEAFEAYLAGEAATSSVQIKLSSIPYGNDRVEHDYSITARASTTDSTYTQSVSFAAVDSIFADDFRSAGTPLCSVDFSVSAKLPTVKAISLPLAPALPLTDFAVRNDIAYVSADSGIASDPDIFVVDMHDKNIPRIRASLDTGPGIRAIAVAGTHIYAAAGSTVAQLHIIHINSLDSLQLENRFSLPLPYATATLPYASSIFYSDGLVYLGTEKWDGQEFNSIDVSDLSLPHEVGSFETGSKVNGMYVVGARAFVAASDAEQLRSIDVSRPSSPALLASFSPSGSLRQEGKVAAMFEGSLLFGRTSGGFDIPADHEAFIFGTSTLDTLRGPSSLNIPGGVYGLVEDRKHLFVAARQNGHEFQILGHDLSTSSASFVPLPAFPERLTCDGDHLYVLSHGSPTLYEITFN